MIGTGSSGVQSIPIIAKQAKHLYVFQRTANFSLPARNAPLDPDKESVHKAQYPERRRAAFDTPFGIAGYPAPVKSALDVTEEERLCAYEAKWAEGGSISFLYSFTDLLINKQSNETASEYVRRKIRATVKDPKTAELLCVQYLRDHGLSRVEAEEDAEDACVRHNNEVADRTLYPLANSWYVGANIPGKPRVFMPYVGGVTAYKKKCDEIAARGYVGFRLGVCLEDQRFAAD